MWRASALRAVQLLISVRSAAEAAAASAGGADIIDAKEPSAGPLGAVSLPVFTAIVATARSFPISAALGDAGDEAITTASVRAFARSGASFVKLGFADVADNGRVAALIDKAARAAAESGTRLVAVAYADYARARSRPPHDIAAAAGAAGAEGVLLDTAVKTGPGLLQLMPWPQIRAWIDGVHAMGLSAAVAGQLREDDLDTITRCAPDIIGLRGAACDGGRTGLVTAHRVQRLSARVRAATAGSPSSAPQGRALG